MSENQSNNSNNKKRKLPENFEHSSKETDTTRAAELIEKMKKETQNEEKNRDAD